MAVNGEKMNQLKALWAQLPHPVQALAILFVTTAGTTLTHSLESGIVPRTWGDAKHMLGTAAVAGIVAVRAFYMLPNKPTAPAAPPPAKA
jgi:hypothetical protein